jgi:3-phosphoglycerate kinase
MIITITGGHMAKQTVRDIDVEGKRVLVRVDYNVPLTDGEVGDPLRIQASFPTIAYLLQHNCRIILISHLGRPDGKVVAKYSLAKVAEKTAELLRHKVTFIPDCIGPEVTASIEAMKAGEIVLLENLRFHAEEEANSDSFSQKLAALADVYVDDAFAVIHRAHASTVGVTSFLPSVAGLLVEQELEHIGGAIDHPNRPLAAIVGGAKVSTKLELLRSLVPKVDILVIGGAMANTFYKAQGLEVGLSLVETDLIDTANELLQEAVTENTELLLPEEVVVSTSLSEPQKVRITSVHDIRSNEYIVDASPQLAQRLKDAMFEVLDFDGKGTVIWNGPVGIDEVPAFASGTMALAEVIKGLKGISVIGGGDTAAFIDGAGMHDAFTWVSTGGGASLELMSGLVLPGVAALPNKH